MVVLAEVMRPNASVRIRKMKMHDLAFPRLENAWVFVLLAQVKVVDDHAHIRMLYPAHHLQSLRSRVQYVALLMAKGLDGENDLMSFSDLAPHAEKVGDLLLCARPGESLRDVAGACASPHYKRCSQAATAGHALLGVIAEC